MEQIQMNFLWECLINFIEIFLFFIFIQTRLHIKTNCSNIRLKQMVMLSLQFFVLCVLNFWDLSSMLTIGISCAFDIVFALFFFEDLLVMRMFWGGMYSIICLIAEYITISVPQTFSHVTSRDVLFGGALRMPFTLLYIALIAVSVFFFRCLSDKEIQFTALQKFFSFLISLSGILIGHYILLLTLESEEKFHDPDFTFRLVLVNLAFLILFLFLFLYIYQLGYSKAINAELIEQQKIYELEEMEYRTLLHTTETLREMKHDMNIHLDVIQSLAAGGSLDELQSYIDSYHHSLAHTHQLLSTGNTAIDCILSSKIAEAHNLNIKTESSVLVPADFPIEALLLSSLLGNMWNNALEACRRLQEANPDITPYIHFYIKPFQHMIVIHMENNYDRVICRNEQYLSMKKGASHGMGLKRMENIISEAGGIFQINAEDHVFTLHIMIPQKETTNETEDFNS